jgi:hypothetical protein
MTKERKPTIWEALAAKLGREPTHKEACDEVRRILFDEGDANPVNTAGRGDPEARHRAFIAKMRAAGITLLEYADFISESRRYVMRRFGKGHIPPHASDEKALDAMIAKRQRDTPSI